MKNILLLTSTIKPNPSQPQLKLVDPLERLNDYKKAFHFYYHALKIGVIDRIVFIDNSGFDLTDFSDFFSSENIEYISFFGLDYPTEYHRGYGEFKLVDYAFAHSKFLTDLDDNDIVWKISGRYIVSNLKNVIKFSPKNFDLYCDIKNNWAEMSVMAWNIAGYNRFIKGINENFKTGMTPELIMAKLVKNEIKSRRGIITTYYWKPLIIGRRGFDGAYYLGKLTLFKFIFICCINFLKLPFRHFKNCLV